MLYSTCTSELPIQSLLALLLVRSKENKLMQLKGNAAFVTPAYCHDASQMTFSRIPWCNQTQATRKNKSFAKLQFPNYRQLTCAVTFMERCFTECQYIPESLNIRTRRSQGLCYNIYIYFFPSWFISEESWQGFRLILDCWLTRHYSIMWVLGNLKWNLLIKDNF